MSGAKRLLEEKEEYRNTATKVLYEIKAITLNLETQQYHDTYNFSKATKEDRNFLFGTATNKLKELYPNKEFNFKLFCEMVDEVFSESL